VTLSILVGLAAFGALSLVAVAVLLAFGVRRDRRDE
jgi:hypothetical protein